MFYFKKEYLKSFKGRFGFDVTTSFFMEDMTERGSQKCIASPAEDCFITVAHFSGACQCPSSTALNDSH
jgi:hypothetical protein